MPKELHAHGIRFAFLDKPRAEQRIAHHLFKRGDFRSLHVCARLDVEIEWRCLEEFFLDCRSCGGESGNVRLRFLAGLKLCNFLFKPRDILVCALHIVLPFLPLCNGALGGGGKFAAQSVSVHIGLFRRIGLCGDVKYRNKGHDGDRNIYSKLVEDDRPLLCIFRDIAPRFRNLLCRFLCRFRSFPARSVLLSAFTINVRHLL